MQRITSEITINMVTGQVLDHKWYWYDGDVDLCCGASDQQKRMFDKQSAFFDQMVQQSQQVFGKASAVFDDLVSAFAPIVAAGPNQKGFSAPEEAALKSAAITNTGLAYKHAKQAVGESQAAVGGGNMALPGGVTANQDLRLANAGASDTANQLNQINLANYATGRSNFMHAAGVLGGSTSLFSPATGMAEATVGAGNSAAQTANEISQANNSWMNLVGGVLGGVASGLTGGLMGGFGGGKGGGGNPSSGPDYDAFMKNDYWG